MTKSLAEIMKLSRVGIDEFDVRYWVQRYVEGLLGGGVRCREVKGGRMVLVAESACLRQELYLLKEDLRVAVQQNTGYEAREIEVGYL
ncbi:MAG: hypothetical protein A3G57_01930 [Candidatus Andersenbacteria bacterium RIFCSPLOWO2_12_FULL_45_8]|nr:MAG: hypothetical protein UW94_C0001G0092 [Parcubacteria group bacterium GW2011_GWA2_45_14]OGY35764.1 MAG: hypothetical protein A3B76_03565 [Candidatus Andersenbacteria bacterium RIFCSPHIGHO2_02_FULL_46_16]OGY38077.1 MAG: hypothetical protein A3I08_05830 [Candidatus Andersenbacteria bacterium RIFCSPLOWO2_02_FULL_46_11]OGY42276.1 MAG: hypothetical protein A3G57_01930 [Candidatus Andersenbacteria bacterium RIFCSPLOWO2_12_FULL_45_8]HBE90169.1 hypothetical protein [Candidatus Andersenbacteria ba